MARGLRDIVWGAAVGDALGVPFEFKLRDSFVCMDMVGYGTHMRPAGTWSDDTSMMLALCDSIRECGRIDCADILSKFRAWYFDGAYTPDGVVFDIGGTTMRALTSGVADAGNSHNGNGSLMRTAPLAVTDATDDEIRAVSAITHAHRLSTEACVGFVHWVRDALADPATTKGCLETKFASSSRDSISSTGYVLHTYEAALWCAATTDNYRDCVLAAVNLGSDTDTTGCVAGALAGAVYGYDAIPAEWLDALTEYLAGTRDEVVKFLAKELPEVKVAELQGTYLMWLDFRYLGLEHKELVKLMNEKAGIGFSSGTDFGELGQGFMRMNIATPRKNVMKAMEQLAAAIKG